MIHKNYHNCWADEASKICPNNRGKAYDAVMNVGGDTTQAYCFYNALVNTKCETKGNKFMIEP